MVGKALIVWGTDTALVWLEAVSNAGWWWLGASLTARDELALSAQRLSCGRVGRPGIVTVALPLLIVCCVAAEETVVEVEDSPAEAEAEWNERAETEDAPRRRFCRPWWLGGR